MGKKLGQTVWLLSKLYQPNVIIGATVATGLFMVSGGFCFALFIATHGNVPISLAPLPDYLAAKNVAFTPAAMLIYALGFVGMLGLTKINNPKYPRFFWICVAFIAISQVGIELLFKLSVTNYF